MIFGARMRGGVDDGLGKCGCWLGFCGGGWHHLAFVQAGREDSFGDVAGFPKTIVVGAEGDTDGFFIDELLYLKAVSVFELGNVALGEAMHAVGGAVGWVGLTKFKFLRFWKGHG